MRFMSFGIRWLRYLAVAATCLVLFSLFALPTRAPARLHEQINSLTSGYRFGSTKHPGPVPFRPDSVHDVWQFWSKAFEDARPQGISKVRLRSNAGTIPVPEGDASARKRDRDRVLNPPEEMDALATAHAKFIQAIKAQGEEENGESVYNGTGIVTVGGGEYFGPAIIGIHMLRSTGSNLPVEVFVADESEWEAELCDDYLPKLGAKCLVITDFLHTGKGIRPMIRSASDKTPFQVTHYQLKSLAMLFCSFAELLYLDSDSIPLVNPATDLFTSEPYISTGLVIWPDFWISTESPQFYNITRLPFPDNFPRSSSEAGQLLINKRTQLKTLLLANYYNIYGPDYYYPLLSQGALGQGDKETFLAAAYVLDMPWYRVKTRVQAVGRLVSGIDKGSGMIQHHPLDDWIHAQAQNNTEATTTRVRPAFLHANTPKMNAGHLVDEGDLLDTEDQHRLRLWGSQASQVDEFGLDVEKAVWELLVQTGCELQYTVREWEKRDRLCERLEEHFQDLFKQN
ncbi:mannosyltransferase putative-domain-containing protein [Delphinella strobiligena]|nr:mannosyltransferase putative-domain-containing protein [Delphinella strobiligena]